MLHTILIRKYSAFKAASVLASLLLVVVAMEASAQTNPIYSPDGKLAGCIDMQTMKSGPCPDTQLFAVDGQQPVEEAFNAGDFKELDRLYAQWCTGKDRFPDGRWKLAWYSKTLFGMMMAWKEWGLHLNRIQEWQKAHPESEAARLAEAVYWRAFAWNARGSGYAETVSIEGWKLARERLEKSLNMLESIQTNCPAKYPVLIDTLTDLGADEDELRRVYEDSIKEFPEYHSIYFAMARHYEPIWGGSTAAYEVFADEATLASEKFEGKAMYARLYWLVDSPNRIPFTNVAPLPPSWQKLRPALEDLTTKYPESQNNLGHFLSVTCRSSDGELYRKLRTALGGYANAADMYYPLDVCDMRHKWESLSQ